MYVQTSGAPVSSVGRPGCGLGCAECGGKCGGRGLGTIDLSTLSWEDYLLLGMGAMLIYSLAVPDSRLFNPAPPKPAKRRKKGGDTGSALSAAAVALAIVGGGYLVYSQITQG